MTFIIIPSDLILIDDKKRLCSLENFAIIVVQSLKKLKIGKLILAELKSQWNLNVDVNKQIRNKC